MVRVGAGSKWSGRDWAYRLCVASACGFFLFGSVELAAWDGERRQLRALAQAVVTPAQGEVEWLTELTEWLSQDVKPGKNRRYHLWRRLDATPIQILEHGGDCEDKAKLLAALLRELGVESSLAMLYPCVQCESEHTVLFVETPAGWTLADPTFGFTFPDGRGGFLAIETLRAEPAILQARLDELQEARGPDDPIQRYKRSLNHYAHMTTFNWNKNALMRGVAGFLHETGAEPWSIPRPLFLEDPKQFFGLLGLACAFGAGLVALLVRPAPGGTVSRKSR